MKALILSILFINLTANTFSQYDTVFIKQSDSRSYDKLIYSTDTILFSSSMTRNIITGTTILPWTHNQQNAKGYGIYFETVTKTECKNSGKEVYFSNDKINSIINTDSTILVDITIYDNCCYDFICDISVDSLGVLNLIYHGYGTYCACNCCFGLVFSLKKTDHMENMDIHSIRLNGDNKTLKKIE